MVLGEAGLGNLNHGRRRVGTVDRRSVETEKREKRRGRGEGRRRGREWNCTFQIQNKYTPLSALTIGPLF